MEMVDIKTWASNEIKTIQVTQGVGDSSYKLKVRQFVPIEGDALSRRWVYEGVAYTYECTPYAVADMTEAGKILSELSNQSLTTAIPFWIKEDMILQKTYAMAHKYSESAEVSDHLSLLVVN